MNGNSDGINFNEVPNWQKRGIGFYWKDMYKQGFNPKTNETVQVVRRELIADFELPMRDQYNQFISALLDQYEKSGM